VLGCGHPAGEASGGRGYLREMVAINQVADPGGVGYVEAPKASSRRPATCCNHGLEYK
jgi:hypothetical protein